MHRLWLLAVSLWVAAPAHAAEDTAAYVRSHYAKYEYRVPMRDGVDLFTTVYVPNDRSRTWPILLMRTPYGVAPYGADRYQASLGPSDAYAKEGFIFAYQDVRGRFMSGGEFVNMRPHRAGREGVDESTDAWDTIDWLVKNVPGNDGKVGMWGISYPGFYASAGAIDSHRSLKAVSPQAPIADWFWDDMHRHGAFVLPLAFDFFAVFGQPRDGRTMEWPEGFDYGSPDGYQFFLDLGPLGNVDARYFKGEVAFWNDLVRHPDYDAFWKARNILPRLNGVRAATLVVGGWFDTEDLYGPLRTYAAIRKQNRRTRTHLVMGPWSHGGWQWSDGDRLGEAEFGFATSKWYREQVELPFFRHHLKGGPDPDLPAATVFETGANRWRRFEAWPPPSLEERSLWFGPAGGLGDAAPEEAEAGDSFVSDPARPVPYTMEITSGWASRYMTEDQRFAAWRPDVLVYQTGPLEEDLTLAGPITADLWVSTTGRDADWIVKVVDVHPGRIVDGLRRKDDPARIEEERRLGGVQRLVRAEAFRGRFRNAYDQPEPFVPGAPARVRFALNDVLHTFKRGHRIMVHVQSTWFPYIDRNPQSWVPNIFEADEADFVRATHTLHRSARHPSRISFGVLRP